MNRVKSRQPFLSDCLRLQPQPPAKHPTSADSTMSHADFHEPPRKKPRFFAEDPPSPPLDETLNHEPSRPDEVNGLPEAPHNIHNADSNQVPADATTGIEGEGFDVELFSSIVGERLPPSSLKKLQEQSRNDLQRGMLGQLSHSWMI
jgi:DNA repair protein RAD5